MYALESAADPLDAVRRGVLQLATRSAFLTRVLGRRDSRIACLAACQVTVLFALAMRVPVALYFIGPVVFGVVHLAADVRYLVLHRAPPRSLVALSAAFAAAITSVQVVAALHFVSARASDRTSLVLGAAWIVAALVAAIRDKVRLAASAAIVASCVWLLFAHARFVGIALVHVHNLVAIGAWLLLFRRRLGVTVLPLILVIGFAAVLLSGVALPWTFASGGLVAFGMRAETLGAWLSPGVRPDVAVALAATFVFLQGVHYAAWTGWIPQDDLRTEGTPTYRMTVRTLERDFGRVWLGLIAVVAVGFAGAAVWNVRDSVSAYLVLAKSHAWFELAFLTYFVVSGQRRRATAA